MTAKLLFSLVLLSFAASAASATIITVDWAGGGDYTLIQDGIDAAGRADTILVMPGTYTGEGNRLLEFEEIDQVLMSSGGPDSVTIDCEGEGRAFYFWHSETLACIVDGFTITNGATTSGGGGMRFSESSPTIRNCVLTGNVADVGGGGVYCHTSASPSFIGCTFSSNLAHEGGGVGCSSGANPSFESCTFLSNTATIRGGGANLDGASADFATCTFEGNSVTGASSRGGGLSVIDGSTATLYDCLFDGNGAPSYGGAFYIATNVSDATLVAVEFTGNTAEYGAAVAVTNENEPLFDACWFVENVAAHDGGAVHSSDGAVPVFDDCTFDDNSAGDKGGAMNFGWFSTPELVSCTFYANSSPVGSGIWCDDNFTLTNCIIAFGVGGEAVHCDGDAPYPSCTDIYGNAGGDWVGCLSGLDLVDNNLHANPLFCDAGEGDLTIDVASPCTAANAPLCGLIGARDIDCDTPVQAESWSAIKAMYR